MGKAEFDEDLFARRMRGMLAVLIECPDLHDEDADETGMDEEPTDEEREMLGISASEEAWA